jgi:hypothetical protein
MKQDNNQTGVPAGRLTPIKRLLLNLGCAGTTRSNMLNTGYVTPNTGRIAYLDTLRLYMNQPNPNSPSGVNLFVPLISISTLRPATIVNRSGAFQPRLGFSYGIDQANRTTVFGSWGIYYDRIPLDVAVDESSRSQIRHTPSISRPGGGTGRGPGRVSEFVSDCGQRHTERPRVSVRIA